jgi:hypothetical protein
MSRDDIIRLLHGPYEAPRVKRGGFLACDLRGKVKVGSWSIAPISWPRAQKGGGFIFCGDLVRALKSESTLAVAHWFAVSPHTIARWKAKLELVGPTPGTRALRSRLATRRATPQWSKKMVELARRPAARAKLSSARKGKPMHPKVRRLFLQMARRPKTERFKQLVREKTLQRVRQGRVPFLTPEQVWLPAEVKLLGLRSDQEVAELLGRTVEAVRLKRSRLGIPPYVENPWTNDELRLLGRLPDEELASRFGRSTKSVEYMRTKLKKPYRASKSRSWTEAELRLLGRFSDAKVAKLTRRTQKAVQRMRVRMGRTKSSVS